MSAAVGRILLGEKTMAGSSVRALADKTGIHYSTVNRILNGERELSLENFLLLCDALRVDPAWVVKEAERRLQSEVAMNADIPAEPSVSPSNVTSIRPDSDVDDWDNYGGSKAAGYDAEADEDEPSTP